MDDQERCEENGSISCALERFKTIALKVQKQINWKKNLKRTRQLLEMMSPAFNSQLETRSVTVTPTFRVTAFTPKSYRNLSLGAKFILMQPPENRNQRRIEICKPVYHSSQVLQSLSSLCAEGTY